MAKYELFRKGWNDTWSGTFQVNVGSTVKENFETGWNNDGWLGVLDTFASATFNGGSTPTIESFSEGWSTSPYKIGYGTAPGGPTTTGTDGFPVPGVDPNGADAALSLGISEGFESGWSNDTWENVFGGGDLSAASFNSSFADAIEGFERVYADQQFTCIIGIIATANASPAPLGGSTITLYCGPGSVLPAPLQVNTPYTCLAVGGHPDQFQVAPLGTGVSFTLTSVGNGTFFVRGDPSKFWVGNDVMT